MCRIELIAVLVLMLVVTVSTFASDDGTPLSIMELSSDQSQRDKFINAITSHDRVQIYFKSFERVIIDKLENNFIKVTLYCSFYSTVAEWNTIILDNNDLPIWRKHPDQVHVSDMHNDLISVFAAIDSLSLNHSRLSHAKVLPNDLRGTPLAAWNLVVVEIPIDDIRKCIPVIMTYAKGIHDHDEARYYAGPSS